MTAAAEQTEPRALRICLLGGARVEGPQPIARLEKKTAALLAYLAVEGATSRSRVAGLLWAESPEKAARNNLAQAIRRLRNASAASFVQGDESLELRGVATDVADLLLSVHQGRFADAAALGGELLAGYDFDDCPDLEGWLKGARGQLARAWARAVNAEIDRAESEDRVDDALVLAERAVASEPLSEAAHLRVARLWLAKGDAPAALTAYERCRKTLARELAMKPSAAMLDVLRTIREGKAPLAVRRSAAPVALPAAVLRPPWVGRARELAELERAFGSRRGAIVVGTPGVGKSRLVREVIERKGSFIVVEGRPGDADVPYATLARGLRALLREVRVELPAWAASELARVVPELATDAAGAPSLRSKLRFLEAFALAARLAVEGGLTAMAVDDLQWVDPASVEALLWIAEQCWSGDLPSFAVIAHRDEELPVETAARVDRAVSAGLARRITLGPLSQDEALQLCRSLGIDALADRLATIVEASHGVPLFLLEIVRATLDAGADDTRVPIPDRVKAIVRRRLERLGDAALRLARVAAVAGPAFDLSLASHVLGVAALDLAEPWAALEAAQILAGGRLSHDVLADVLREDLPRVVREHVHARTAEHLAVTGADPADVARHFEAGGREGAAAPYFLKAGHAARGLSRVTDAARLFERAARAYESAGDASGACEALYQLVRGAVGDEADGLATRLDQLAVSPRDRARARSFRAGGDVAAGRYDAADVAAREAAELAREVDDPLILAKALQVRLDAAIRSGRVGPELDDLLSAFDASCVSLADPEGLAAAALYHGEVELLRERPAEALPHVATAIGHLERWGQLLFAKARLFAARARIHVALGDLDAARADLGEADAALRDAVGAVGAHAHVRIARAEVALASGDGKGAIEALGELPGGDGLPRDVRTARVLRAEALGIEKRWAEAEPEIDDLIKDPLVDARLRARAALARCRGAAERGAAPKSAWVKLVHAMGSASQVRAVTSGSSSRHRG